MVRRLPVLTTLAFVASLAACQLAGSPDTNVPDARLAAGVYTAPDGAWSLRVPDHLISLEEQGGDGPVQSLLMVGPQGAVWSVRRLEDQGDASLDGIAADFEMGHDLLEKTFVDTARGRELRMLGVEKGASPMENTHVDGGNTPLDLINASAVFLHGGSIYELNAGVTPLADMTEGEPADLAGQRLEALLAGFALE